LANRLIEGGSHRYVRIVSSGYWNAEWASVPRKSRGKGVYVEVSRLRSGTRNGKIGRSAEKKKTTRNMLQWEESFFGTR